MKAAVLYNVLILQPSILKISIPHTMLCSRPFSYEESQDKTLQKRVKREARRKETREAAKVKSLAAAQITLGTTTADISVGNPEQTEATDAPIPNLSPDTSLLEEPKKMRKTSKQKAKERTNKMLQKRREDFVFVQATLQYVKEKSIKGGRSAETIARMYNKEFNVNISPRTILQRVHEGRAGEPLSFRGRKPAGLSDETMKLLEDAFISYMQLVSN